MPRPDRRPKREGAKQGGAKQGGAKQGGAKQGGAKQGAAGRGGAKRGGAKRSSRPLRKPLPARPAALVEPDVFLRRLVGERRAAQLSRNLRKAADAFGEGRNVDARTALTPLVREAPNLPEGRELMGLAMYRLGRWAEAAAHLEAFRELSASTEQNPILADCHRALGNYDDVEALWRELGEVSPSAELVTEGRIVAAGAKADQGNLEAAIAVLSKGWSRPRQPRPHHLSRAYALADLYDRAGFAARSRSLFAWIAEHDPRFADVAKRVKSLG